MNFCDCGYFSDNSTCTISGNVHYMTFDGEFIQYQGTCKHVLVQTTYDAPMQFSVYAKNEKYHDSPVSVLSYVEVFVNDTTIRFWRHQTAKEGINSAKVSVSNDSDPDMQV